jgi:hypothetical protein
MKIHPEGAEFLFREPEQTDLTKFIVAFQNCADEPRKPYCAGNINQIPWPLGSVLCVALT